MGGFFLRPKDTNLDEANNHINAEAIGVVSDYEDEYTGTTSVAEHKRRHPSEASEAKPDAPLPTGGAPKGHTGRGVRGWRGPVSKTVSSGFGRGTRAGKGGRRR